VSDNVEKRFETDIYIYIYICMYVCVCVCVCFLCKLYPETGDSHHAVKVKVLLMSSDQYVTSLCCSESYFGQAPVVACQHSQHTAPSKPWEDGATKWSCILRYSTASSRDARSN